MTWPARSPSFASGSKSESSRLAEMKRDLSSGHGLTGEAWKKFCSFFTTAREELDLNPEATEAAKRDNLEKLRQVRERMPAKIQTTRGTRRSGTSGTWTLINRRRRLVSGERLRLLRRRSPMADEDFWTGNWPARDGLHRGQGGHQGILPRSYRVLQGGFGLSVIFLHVYFPICGIKEVHILILLWKLY